MLLSRLQGFILFCEVYCWTHLLTVFVVAPFGGLDLCGTSRDETLEEPQSASDVRAESTPVRDTAQISFDLKQCRRVKIVLLCSGRTSPTTSPFSSVSTRASRPSII